MRYSNVANKRSRGFSVLELFVMVCVVAVLAGLILHGTIWIRSRADLAVLTSRCQQLGTALQLHYQKTRTYPDAFPAHLEEDLASYITDEAFFTSSANPAARAAPLNVSYVTPVLGYKHAYVLGLDTRYDEDVSVVLFSDSTTEVVEKLPVLHNGEPIVLGNRATGGTVTFASSSEVTLNGSTVATVVNSFRSADGTSFNVVKFDKGEASGAQLNAVDTDIIQLVSYAGIAFLRGGVADAVGTVEDNTDKLSVATYSGEVRLIGRTIASAPPAEEDEEEGGGGAGGAVSGRVNLNPSNNSGFSFVLRKPDGTYITRADLHDSNRQLEYFGEMSWVLFRPKGNGNQNSLTLNSEVYELQNGRLYLIIGSDLSGRLYNDKKNSKGKAMGRGWLDSVSATDAHIFPLNWDYDELPDEDDFEDYYDLPEPPPDDGSAEDGGDDESQPTVLNGKTVRTLSRGFCVAKGKSQTVAKRR